MLSIICNRCKTVINSAKRSNYFKITREDPRDDANELDLCDSCYREFINWIEEGKENEE